LDLGIGDSLPLLRSVDLRPAEAYGNALPSDAPRGAGILYSKTQLVLIGSPNEYEYIQALLSKIRIKREKSGFITTTSAGPVSARIILSTSLGSRSIPISLDTCYPVFGDGPISITIRRPVNLKSFLPNPDAWLNRPIDFADAFVSQTLELPPFKQNKNLFSVVADLSLLTERETQKNGNGTSKIEVTGPASCGGRFYAYESAFNKRGYAMPGIGFVMDPTKPWYGEHSKQLTSNIYLPVVTHEFGHVLGQLRDEYDNIEWNPGSDPAYAYFNGRNCSAASNLHVAFPPPANTPSHNRAICGARGLYRSTIGSMMNDQYTHRKFNVVSCAYLLAEMRGGSASDYYATCEQKEYDAYRE
jgi:hypothetical protein